MAVSRLAIYLTHPEVVIDPAVAVTDWKLSKVGQSRISALAVQLQGLGRVQVVTSAERKALESAWPLAAASGRALIVRPGMHENDRSATGYLPGPQFEATADAFFGAPETSVSGWEKAIDAQTRIVAEIMKVAAAQPRRSLLFTGHGAVGTLLYCHLAGLDIDRKWDQPGPGHWFAFDPDTGTPLGHWAPIETLTAI